ncbi:DoxX family protein [Granulicella arctica]|uniref:Putative oxidoreductase n=1 Tax=Granulicella arctica TaxID=940613 RepID=A0A7Y9THX5_9BACT|nr:DoxX family protein [Granulicella arctica]NYF80380.1 putative oxidoreductase [Granulicella arctica]
MTRWLNGLQPWGVVLLRLVLAAAMLYNGWGKVFPAGGFHGHMSMAGVDHFCRYVVTLGLPYWLGYASVFAEVIGGLGMLVGLFVRFFALLIAGNMLFAILFVTGRHGYAASEYPIALLAIAIMLLLTGPGRMALDRRMGLI